MLFLGAIFVCTLVSSALLTWVYLRWALRHQVLDHPNSRSFHAVPTPRGGGIGIVLAVSANLLFWSCYRDAPGPELRAVGVAAVVLAAMGWIDDLRGLPALLRLAVQIGVSLILVRALSASFSLPAFSGERWLELLLLATWIIVHLNFYNFMDGIDGLAGCQAMVVGLAWLVAGCWQASALIAGLGCALSAASLGFLLFNWPPARIFMGDVGSVSVGFFAAVLPLLPAQPSHSDALIFAAIISWPFIFDATVTLGRRLLRRENLLQAHRSHYYQALVASGWTHRKATLTYASWALACAVAGIYWLIGLPYRNMLVALVLALPAGLLARLVAINGPSGSRP